MKPTLYTVLIIGLVPIQTTVLQHLSVAGIRPDLCLIAVSLVGFFGGAFESLLLGVALGFIQDLFSADAIWLNMGTKGLIGLMAGVAGRYLAHATPASMVPLMLGLSILSGSIFLMAGQTGGLSDTLAAIRLVLLPQAAFDAVVGAGLYLLLVGQFRKDEAPA